MFKEIVSVIQNSSLTLPALEVTLLMALLSLALLFRYSRTGIVVAYLFTYRWGWNVTSHLGSEARLIYLIFGCTVAILSILGMLADTKQ